MPARVVAYGREAGKGKGEVGFKDIRIQGGSHFNGLCVRPISSISVYNTIQRQTQLTLHAPRDRLVPEGRSNQKTTVLNTMWRARTLDWA